MNILFSTLRNTSHFYPLIPFIDACRDAGHTVAVAAPPDFEKHVAPTGAAFFPFGHPGEEGLGPHWARFRGASEEETLRISIGDIFADACAGAALPALLDTMERWRPAVVVRESQEYAALIGAEKLRIPHLRVAISAPSGETTIFKYAAAAVDKHAQAVGLPPDPEGRRLHEEAALTLFPASLESPGIATGPVLRFRASRKPAPPLPDWWSGGQAPFVYITLGTVVGGFDIMRAAYRTMIDAVADLPVRILLTVGADLPLEILGEVPPHIHIERFVPQDQIIPHAAAVVCHGGSGTVLGSFATGVPLVVAPFFADQPFNAERATAAGAALSLPTRGATAANVRQGLSRVLEEPAFRAAARALAAEIAALPPIADAAAAIARQALPVAP